MTLLKRETDHAAMIIKSQVKILVLEKLVIN